MIIPQLVRAAATGPGNYERELNIPAGLAGSVIGQKGSTIRAIQSASGAKIKLQDITKVTRNSKWVR